jgi:hypothetical protein
MNFPKFPKIPRMPRNMGKMPKIFQNRNSKHPHIPRVPNHPLHHNGHHRRGFMTPMIWVPWWSRRHRIHRQRSNPLLFILMFLGIAIFAGIMIGIAAGTNMLIFPLLIVLLLVVFSGRRVQLTNNQPQQINSQYPANPYNQLNPNESTAKPTQEIPYNNSDMKYDKNPRTLTQQSIPRKCTFCEGMNNTAAKFCSFCGNQL